MRRRVVLQSRNGYRLCNCTLSPARPPSDDPAARPMVAGSSGGFTGGVLAPSPVNSANSRGGARQPRRQRKGKPPCPISVARNSVPVMVGHAHGPLSRIRIARIPSYHPNHGAYETMMQHLWPARAASLIFDAPEGSLPVCHKHTSPMPRPTTASAATAAPEQRALARFVAAWIQAVVASRASPRRRRPHPLPRPRRCGKLVDGPYRNLGLQMTPPRGSSPSLPPPSLLGTSPPSSHTSSHCWSIMGAPMSMSSGGSCLHPPG